MYASWELLIINEPFYVQMTITYIPLPTSFETAHNRFLV